MSLNSFLIRKSLYLNFLKYLVFLFFLGLMVSFNAFSQTQGYYDFLELIKTNLDQGQIDKALELANLMELQHSGEENLVRLKGKALYWSKDFEAAKSYFRSSLKEHPDMYWARLDFARILYELNEQKESKENLELCWKVNPSEPETNQKLAELNYWSGGRPKISYEYLDKILEPFPTNEPAKALKNQIQTATSPYLGVSGGYYSDSQPMEYFNFLATGNFYYSSGLQPGFLAEVRSYSSGIAAHILQASNKSTLPSTRTSLILRGGMSNSSGWENAELIYGGEIQQEFSKNLRLSVSADRESYFHTLASLSEPIMPFVFRTSFGREMGSGWTGKILFQNSSFEDENWVKSFSGWILVPIWKIPKLTFDLGYAVNLADSKEVRFSEDLPIKNTIRDTEFGDVIPGSYNPYFTPINNQIHGALGRISVFFSPKVNLVFSGNVALFAKIDNPNTVYYGANPSNGNAPISQEDIYLILVETTYNPLDFKSTLNWKTGPKSGISLSYQYQKTIFFDTNSINLNYSFRIWNDK